MVYQSQQIETGTRFWQIYQGSTATGFGQVSKIWEVEAYKGNGNYLCKAISDNTVGRLNPNYTETFSEAEIIKILKQTPILNAAPNKRVHPHGGVCKS